MIQLCWHGKSHTGACKGLMWCLQWHVLTQRGCWQAHHVQLLLGGLHAAAGWGWAWAVRGRRTHTVSGTWLCPSYSHKQRDKRRGFLFALDIDKALHGDNFWCLVVCGRYVWTVTLRGPAVHGGCRIVQPQPHPSVSASELCFSQTEKIPPPKKKKMVKETLEKTRLVEILPVLGYKHIPALWQCPRLAASSCYLIMIYCI